MMPRNNVQGKEKPETHIDTNLGGHGNGGEVATTSHHERYNAGWPDSLPLHARAHITPSHVSNKHYCRVPSSRPKSPVEVCLDDDARGVVVMGGGGSFEG